MTHTTMKLHIAGWCIWFAIAIASPFPTICGEGYSIAFGPVSLSPVFSASALGLAAGLFLTTCESLQYQRLLHPAASRLLTVAGASASTLLSISSWSNMIMLHIGFPHSIGLWDPGRAATLSWGASIIIPFISLVLTHSILFAGIGSFLCGFFYPSNHIAINHANVQSPTSAKKRLVTIPIVNLLGFLQPMAWILLMPHSSFPQPSLLDEPVTVNDLWICNGILGVLTSALPFFLMNIFAAMCIWHGNYASEKNTSSPPPLCLFCFSIALSYGLLAVIPSSYCISENSATISTLLYCACYVISIAVLYRDRNATVRNAFPMPAGSANCSPLDKKTKPDVSRIYTNRRSLPLSGTSRP